MAQIVIIWMENQGKCYVKHNPKQKETRNFCSTSLSKEKRKQ